MKYILIILIIIALFFSACSDREEKLEQYKNCTAACAVAIDEPIGEDSDEFTALNYCNEECKKKFL